MQWRGIFLLPLFFYNIVFRFLSFPTAGDTFHCAAFIIIALPNIITKIKICLFFSKGNIFFLFQEEHGAKVKEEKHEEPKAEVTEERHESKAEVREEKPEEPKAEVKEEKHEEHEDEKDEESSAPAPPLPKSPPPPVPPKTKSIDMTTKECEEMELRGEPTETREETTKFQFKPTVKVCDYSLCHRC